MSPARRPLVDRFNAKVDRSDASGCWVWVGSKDSRGYGKIGTNRTSPGGFSMPSHAHRVAYELEHGAIPPGLVVRHRCDRPSCVRPDHLELGTQADNMHDAAVRGRMARGERNNRAILTDEQVRKARDLARTTKKTIGEIATEVGGTVPSVGPAIRGVSWAHLDAECPPVPGGGYSDDDIRTIRALRAQGVSLSTIGRQFGMSISNVSRVARRRTHAHVPDAPPASPSEAA